MNRKKIAEQILALAKQIVAFELPSEEAKKKYEQEHEVQPDTKITVKQEEDKSKPAQPEEQKQAPAKSEKSVPVKPPTQPAEKPAEKPVEKPAEKPVPYKIPENDTSISPDIKEILKNPSPKLKEQIDKLETKEEHEDFNKRLRDYNLEATGVKPEVATLVAASLAAGINETADTCKLTPPVCKGNLGLKRANMPQLHDKNLKDMLAGSVKDDAKGEALEKKAAAETDEKKKKDLTDAAAEARGKAEEGRKKIAAAKKMGVDENETRSTMDIFLDDLTKSGVQIEGRKGSGSTTKVPVKDLRATQREIQAKKTMEFADGFLKYKAEPGKKPWSPNKEPIIVSTEEDGSHCILDGHHRWSAALVAKPDMEFDCIVVKMPIRDMLAKAHKSPGVYRADLQSNVIDPDVAGEPDLSGWKPGEEMSTAETPVEKKSKTSSMRRKQAAHKLLLLAKSILEE